AGRVVGAACSGVGVVARVASMPARGVGSRPEPGRVSPGFGAFPAPCAEPAEVPPCPLPMVLLVGPGATGTFATGLPALGPFAAVPFVDDVTGGDVLPVVPFPGHVPAPGPPHVAPPRA